MDLSSTATTVGGNDTTRNHVTGNHNLLGLLPLLGLYLLQHNKLLGLLLGLHLLLGHLLLLGLFLLLRLFPMQQRPLLGHQKHQNTEDAPSFLLGEAISDMWLQYILMTDFV